MNVANARDVFFENIDGWRIWRCFGRTGGYGNGTDSKPGQRLQVGSDHCLCGRRYGNDNSAGSCVGRFAATERRMFCAPRREAVDLRTHDRIQEFGSARRQFERLEEKPFSPQYQLDAAAAPRGLSGGLKHDDLAIFESKLTHIRSRCMNGELSALSFDQTNGTRRCKPCDDCNHGLGNMIQPAPEATTDCLRCRHRMLVFERSSVDSSPSSSRQDSTRNGSVSSSRRRMTASERTWRWASNRTSTVTLLDLPGCTVAYWASIPSCAVKISCGAPSRRPSRIL